MVRSFQLLCITRPHYHYRGSLTDAVWESGLLETRFYPPPYAAHSCVSRVHAAGRSCVTAIVDTMGSFFCHCHAEMRVTSHVLLAQ